MDLPFKVNDCIRAYGFAKNRKNHGDHALFDGEIGIVVSIGEHQDCLLKIRVDGEIFDIHYMQCHKANKIENH